MAIFSSTRPSPIWTDHGASRAVDCLPQKIALPFPAEGVPVVWMNAPDWGELFCSDLDRPRSVQIPQIGRTPIRINWDVVTPSLWTGAGGIVVGMVSQSSCIRIYAMSSIVELRCAGR